jgi:hypothetical protein
LKYGNAIEQLINLASFDTGIVTYPHLRLEAILSTMAFAGIGIAESIFIGAALLRIFGGALLHGTCPFV